MSLRVLLLLCLSSCTPPPVAAKDFGRSVFADPRLSPSKSNTLSCATCHDTSGQQRYLPGHSLANAAFRTSFFGGTFLDLFDATNFCFVYFMGGVRPLNVDAPESKALYEYLVSLSPSQATEPMAMTVVRHVDVLPPGDPALGAEVYVGACQSCHGEPHSGEGREVPNAPLLPEVTEAYDALFPRSPRALPFIEKVRHGQFLGVGGNMPFYSVEALNDTELSGLISFLSL